ncbi:MAG: hypothetical protein V4633_24835 [Pseudomonadota bacterium]
MFRSSLKKIITAGIVFGAASVNASAQSTCGAAVAQLQQYVASVNHFANKEYYQDIPGRCGGNPMCMQSWLQQLNGWYMSQSAMVNGWYGQILANCSSKRQGRPIGGNGGGNDAPPELDEDDVADIDVDDEDKTVRIRIPDTAMGYRQRR